MNSLLLIVALACVAVSEAVVKPRTLRRQQALLDVLAADLSGRDCQGQAKLCADCLSVLSCSRLGDVFRPVSVTACPAATPYCSEGQCVAALPAEDDACNVAPSPVDEILCNGDGYYPDPAACNKYYLCVGGLAYEYDCTGYASVYSHAKAMCVHSNEAVCKKVTCRTSDIQKYQPWGQDASVYFVCTDTTAANAYVAACPPDHVVDDKGDCVVACEREGRLAIAGVATQYYECLKTGAKTFSSPLPLSCPSGSAFDATEERCVIATTQ